MAMLNKLRLRLRALFFKSEMEDELQAELRFHLEREIEENITRGMTPEEARFAALRSFGGIERVMEESRDERGIRLLEEVWQDLRYGARMLRKQPGFTLIAALTLALGIGANTAIFSIVNAVLLRPLPYPESDRLMFLSERIRWTESLSVSWPNYLDWRVRQSSFERIGVYRYDSYNLTGGGEPERLQVGQVSADLFAALRVDAALGRVFTDDEDRPGVAPVVVLSQGLWRRRFGGDPNILDRTITLNDRSFTVLGVMPAGFQFPNRV